MNKVKIMISVIFVSCIFTVAVHAQSDTDFNDTTVVESFYTDLHVEDKRGSDTWYKDVMTRVVEAGSGEIHTLENYVPRESVPFISFSAPYDTHDIPAYRTNETSPVPSLCKDCHQEMIYVDILYEINPYCGHGIFTRGYYCETDDIFTPEFFYDQCGCWTMGD